MAARGYWQAFQAVKASVAGIIGGANSGALVRTAHRDWYRELFQPCVAAGLLPASALAGYRNYQVYLRTSRYIPPRWETVRDAMPALFDLIEQEPEPGVRAVLGHWLFGYIHPYPDGNGRVARFLMNAMLASGGDPWTVIRVEDRDAYWLALKTRCNSDVELPPHGQGRGAEDFATMCHDTEAHLKALRERLIELVIREASGDATEGAMGLIKLGLSPRDKNQSFGQGSAQTPLHIPRSDADDRTGCTRC